MEQRLLLTSERDGLEFTPTKDGRVQINTTFGGTRLQTLVTTAKSEELCELLWIATCEAKRVGGEGS